jgi:radical SAM protein with 4Fe4S-binding SPASM domain
MVVTPRNKNQIYSTGKMLIEQFGIQSFTATPAIPPFDAKNKTILTREEHIKLLDDLGELRDEYGTYTGSLHPVVPCMFDEDQREKYTFFFDSKSCTAGRGSVAFSRRGDVRVCTQEWTSHGNILIEPLERILERIEPWGGNQHVPEKCEPCDYSESCRGGCRVASKSVNGSFDSPEPYSQNPITNRKLVEKTIINFPNLEIAGENIRYREDSPGIYTLYLNPNAYVQVKEQGLNVFKRYLAGKTFGDIVHETGDEEGIKNFSKLLFESGLLK